MLNYVRKFFKIRAVFHTLYLWHEVGDPQFFAFISDTSKSSSDCSKKFLKNLSTGTFSRERKKALFNGLALAVPIK